MKTLSLSTVLHGMAYTLGSALILQGFTALPLLFSLAIVIAAIATVFGLGVVVQSIVMPVRAPVSMRRIRARATA